jgi:hypothetical protein
MLVHILFAYYKDFYQEVSSEIIGIFTDEKLANDAIKEYKKQKIKYHAECLLETTTFEIVPVTLNESVKYGIKRY